MVKKVRDIKPAKPDPLLDLGSVVSERVQIQNVHLLETRAKRGSIRENQPLHLQFSVNVTTQVDDSTAILLVRPLLTLVGKYEEMAGGEEALRIEALFNIAYRMNSTTGLDKANFDAFGATNGLYNAWPFWREYVQTTTARLGLSSLTIPVLPPAKRDAEVLGRIENPVAKPVRGKRK